MREKRWTGAESHSRGSLYKASTDAHRSRHSLGGTVVRTSTAEKNNYICPACGDALRQDSAGRGFVRHVGNRECQFERGLKDSGDDAAVRPQRPASSDRANPTKIVREQQRCWAVAHDIEIDESGYTLTLDDNLFVPLSPASRSEYVDGDGAELGSPGCRGKMQALHSSSALVSNVFEYWRGSTAQALATALGVTSPITDIGFERKFPTGLPGNSPNLDAVLELSDRTIVAVESKFLEPYSGRHMAGFKPKYFEATTGLWKRRGYSRCQQMAERLEGGDLAFRWLNAEQLLKHILGLAHCGLEWELLYLWYQPPGPAGLEHAVEAQAFTDDVVADGIVFRSMTYQALFDELHSSESAGEADYLAYLESRYFVNPAPEKR